jgi:hypothetical protein
MIEGKRYYTKGKLTRLVVDGIDMKITRETIKPKGYKEWVAVTYMDTNENREHCAEWVLGLIAKGILKREEL